jgi:hypothetical protein
LLGLLDLLEADLVAERFKLAFESAGAMFGRVTLALRVGSELRGIAKAGRRRPWRVALLLANTRSRRLLSPGER